MCVFIYIYMCVCVCVCLYIYIYMNHFAVYLKLTQHCKSTVLQYKIKIKKNGVKGDQEKKISTVNF